MNEFIATFHTHADAILAHRDLAASGVDARMMPVPRKLSSSCGTCVRFTSEKSYEEKMKKADAEAIYKIEGIGAYTKIYSGDDNE